MAARARNSGKTSAFLGALADRASDPAGRTWVYLPYDQLSQDLPVLAGRAPEQLGIVFIENPEKASRRPYHKQKLALVLANGRQFLLEQAARGVAIDFRVARAGYARELRAAARAHGPLLCAEPAERELRHELAGLFSEGALLAQPAGGFLTSREEFRASQRRPDGSHRPPWRLDAFYRHVRSARVWLLEGGRPKGGKWSLDAENREPWRGQPPAPKPLRFAPDPISAEVGELIEQRFAEHPGRLDLTALPTTLADARAQWEWAKRHALPHFGPYEDAFSLDQPVLFHSLLSPLLNLSRLLPAALLEELLALDLPLQSQEGFLRQVLGWREFVRHVHQETDGFRSLPQGFARDHLGAKQPLPAAFWPGAPSGLACLDGVVGQVWDSGYSHHITRLMVLSNIATLLDLDPRELTDWVWCAYVDAFDWVVEPNVLGMGTFSLGELFTTKPYVSGAAYLDRMGDACKRCAFDPKRDCPLTPLYWAFLARHRERLHGNPRLFMPLNALKKRSPQKRAADAAHYEAVQRVLSAGGRLAPGPDPGTLGFDPR
jgi:deoxyribodipyrimidine photolyase-related protein